MNGKIFCLMTGGLYLSDAVRDLLFYMAIHMFDDKANRKSIRTSECEGEIRTQFEPASLGTIGGVVFTAEIQTETVSSTVRYIVRTRDLEHIEDAVWIRLEPEHIQNPANAHGMN